MRRADGRYRGRKPRGGLFGAPAEAQRKRVRWGEETQGSGRSFRRKTKTERSGLWVDEEQVILLSLVALAAILMLTMRASSVWTGQTYGEQIYQALFVTEDWE